MARKRDDRAGSKEELKRGITRRELLGAGAASVCLGALGVPGSANAEEASVPKSYSGLLKKPNFLIIMCDEMRFPPEYETAEAKAFRKQFLRTQEALKNTGIEFTRHYAASVACAPSRATIYTGQYPSLHGVTQTTGAAKEAFDPDVFWLDPNSVPTIGHYFRQAGYQTYWVGKWHASDADMLIPCTHSQLTSYDDTTGEPDPQKEALYLNANRLDRHGFAGWIGPEPHGRSPLNSGSSANTDIYSVNGRDEAYASQAVQLINTLSKGRQNQPWVTVVSFVNPHDITLYGVLTEHLDQFEFDVEPVVPQNLLDPAPCGPSQNEQLATNNKPRCQLSYRDAYRQVFQPIGGRERYVQFYYQLQKNVDEQMWRVYQALMKSRFADDTYVIFLSDHGDLLGSHGDMHQKWYTAYEEAIHVPFIISNPRLFPRGRKVDSITSHVDLLPTMLGLAGLNPETLRSKIAPSFSDALPLVGRNLAPMIFGHVRPEQVNDPIYFMTDDDVSRGLNQDNWTGIPYNSVVQPNHLHTVIARLRDNQQNLKIWKFTQYFDNPQFWSDPGTPCPPPNASDCASDVVVIPPAEQTPTEDGVYTAEYTITVKNQPLRSEFEMYNLTDDPYELNNLYNNPDYAQQQSVLEMLLMQQCAQKRLRPVNGTVPGQPDCSELASGT